VDQSGVSTSVADRKGCFGSCLAATGSITGIVLLVVGMLVIAYFGLTAAGGLLIIADPLKESDAITVLSGGQQDRFEEAARLYREHYARVFIITNPNVNLPDTGELYAEHSMQTVRELGVSSEYLKVTELHENTTTAEARALRQYAADHQIDSLIVVTDPYHTMRTRLIFRRAFNNSGVHIIVRPVRDHWYNAGAWWMTAEGRQQTVAEYVKILGELAGLE